MTIVHVVEPFASGVAVFVKYLTETMPQDLHLIVHGERKEVMPAREVKRIFQSPNVRFIKWRSAQRAINPLKDFLALAELCNILRRLKNKNMIDSVHLHSAKSGLLGRIACRILGVRNVFYTPNAAPFLSSRTALSKYFYRQMEKLGNSLGGKVVCCSPSELNAYLQLGIDAIHISNGTDIEEKMHYPTVVAKREKFRIITTGRIITQKNPSLFNSIAQYFNEFDQFEFYWVGDGEERRTLTAKNINITGWVDQSTIKSLVTNSDIYISTSLYEGLSFGVLEALTLQKPVLLSHCIGNMDVVKNGINGDLFRTKTEAIVKILQYHNNRAMLPIMGEFSKSICDTEFNVRRNFSNYRELYLNSLDDVISQKWEFA